MRGMKRFFLLVFTNLLFSSGTSCGEESECEKGVQWKRHKESGPFCYRYFTGDERNTFMGALAVCRYVHNATLIDMPLTAEEVHFLGIENRIWIANPKDANLSLEWNETPNICYFKTSSGVKKNTIQCANKLQKVKSMCSAERVAKNPDADIFQNEDYQFSNRT